MHFQPSRFQTLLLTIYQPKELHYTYHRCHPLISLLEGNFNIIQCSKLSPETEKAALREVKIAQGFAPGSVVFCTQSLGTHWGVIYSEGTLSSIFRDLFKQFFSIFYICEHKRCLCGRNACVSLNIQQKAVNILIFFFLSPCVYLFKNCPSQF